MEHYDWPVIWLSARNTLEYASWAIAHRPRQTALELMDPALNPRVVLLYSLLNF